MGAGLFSGSTGSGVTGAPRHRRLLPRPVIAFVVFLALVTAGLVAMPAPAQAACTGNAVVCENQLPGTSPSIWDIRGVGDSTIQGFATKTSVNAGSRVDFKIDTDARAYTVEIYRLGFYQGNGARRVDTITPSAALPQQQPACATSAATEIYDCGTWGISASWNVPSTAVSGVYIARLIRTDTGGDSHIPFVVRNDGNTSDVLFQTSDTTWQAYNLYGGSSFYGGKDNGRAYKLSYNRPYSTRGLADGRDFLFSNEYPAIRYLEQNGYNVSYVAGLDVSTDPALLPKHKTFISIGHDEYWTAGQRKNVTDARDAGVNLAFLGGNDVYWKSRWEPSQDGSATANRTLVTYKDTWANAQIDDGAGGPTPTWRDPRFGALDYGYGPENALIGTQFQANSVDMAMQVNAREGKLRLWRNTTLASMTAGSTATLSDHTVGYEANEDVDNGYRPAGLVDLSTTTGTIPQYLVDYGNTVVSSSFTHHVTLYRAASGALVFSAGTVQWGWGLDSNHDGTATPADPRMRQATANLLADMGPLPTTPASDVTLPSRSTDTTPPSISVTTPTAGASATQGSLLTVSGTASDVGGQVAGVEVSVDGGASFHPADGTTSWSYQGVLTGNGAGAIQVRATDDSARTSPVVKVALNSPCPCSLFGVATPKLADAADGADLTLGTKFTSSASGYVTGIRFYKASTNVGTHTGTLYSSTGTALATGTFTNETASGWQTLLFSAPVAISAGVSYVAAYHAPSGHYSADGDYFTTTRTAGVLSAPGGTSATNGVYATGVGFPNSSYNQTNYWVDPIYTETDDTPVVVTAYKPAVGATSVAVTALAKATFNKDVATSSLSMQMTDQNQVQVPGSVTYDAASRTATFNPTQGLAGATTYKVTVNATGLASAVQWSFTTADPDSPTGVCPCTLFNDDDAPTAGPDSDTQRVQLGMAFTVRSPGQLSGVRFYKTPENAGPHTVALWSGGTKLAETTLSTETSSGWQQGTFDSAVAISAGPTYVVSYTAPNGRYSYTAGGLADPVAKGAISSLATGGRYTYGTGAPNTTTATNYFVDPVFLPSDSSAPVVRSVSPGDGATSVMVSGRVTATFGYDIQPGSAVMRLKRAADGTTVPGTTTGESQGPTATFIPATDLDPGTRYTATISGARSPSGVPMTGTTTVSFTTSGAGACPCSLLETTTKPSLSDSGDTAAVTLGVKFTPTVNGFVKGLRYYRDATNTGTHTGTFWSAGGSRLADVTFSDSGTGWQTATFATSVPVSAGTTYVASYYAPNGHYSAELNYYATDVSNPPLRSVDPGGVYLYGSGFPSQTYLNTNYFVDVVFTTNADDPPSVTTVTPAAGSSSVPVNTTVTATFDRALDATSVNLAVSDPSGQLIGGQLAYDAASRKATFTTASPLVGGAVYTATASANSASGVAITAPKTWTFTTTDTTPPATTAVTPTEGAAGVGTASKVTATFASPVDPASPLFTVTRADTGATVTGTTTYDAATRTASFTPSAALVDLTSYNASVSARNTSGISMPTPKTWTFTTADSVVPTVTGTMPAAAATGFAVGAPLSATFARPVDPATVQWTLKTAAGAAVVGVASYNTTSRIATFTPTAALASATSYTATVTAKNASGLAMPSAASWSFTTLDTTAPSLSGRSPAANATGVALASPVTATFARPITASSLVVILKTSAGAAVTGTTTYNATTRVATFTPATALTSSTGYTASVSASSAAGIPMAAPDSWSFTTVAATFSLYPTTRTPTATVTTLTPTTVGVQFTSSRAGKVTGIRYYANSTNLGRTVKLWSGTGGLLGTATTSQSGTGWRTANFATPVSITAGASYVASYYAPFGRWSTTTGGYATPYTAGPLTVPTSGARSSTGDVFPTSSTTTNLWVDVLVLI